jgi:hypothetical protein
MTIDTTVKLDADGRARACELCGYDVNEVAHWCAYVEAINAELLAALQRIVDEADSDDGLTAWDGGDIARAALAKAREKTLGSNLPGPGGFERP